MISIGVLMAGVLGLMVFASLASDAVKAEAKQSEYTGTETVDEIQNEGVWEPLPNGGMHFRGQEVTTIEVANDPRASGSGTLVSNGNLDPTGTGPIWGTIALTVPASEDCEGGGEWQGTWAGKMSIGEGYVYWFGVMQGVSGCVEGMMVRFESELCTPQAPCAYSGTLVDPQGE